MTAGVAARRFRIIRKGERVPIADGPARRDPGGLTDRMTVDLHRRDVRPLAGAHGWYRGVCGADLLSPIRS